MNEEKYYFISAKNNLNRFGKLHLNKFIGSSYIIKLLTSVDRHQQNRE